jgi:hypothetical protein
MDFAVSWLSDIEAEIAAGTLRVVSDAVHRRDWEARRKRQAMVERAAAERIASELSLDAIQCAIDARSLGSGAVAPYAAEERRVFEAALAIKREKRVKPARALFSLIAQARRRTGRQDG